MCWTGKWDERSTCGCLLGFDPAKLLLQFDTSDVNTSANFAERLVKSKSYCMTLDGSGEDMATEAAVLSLATTLGAGIWTLAAC